MSSFTFLNRCVLGATAFAMLSMLAGPVSAQSDAEVSSDVQRPTIDRRLGEGEQILRRHEWFFSSRTAGAANADERARLRREAAGQAKAVLDAQRALRAEGRVQAPPTRATRSCMPSKPQARRGPSRCRASPGSNPRPSSQTTSCRTCSL